MYHACYVALQFDIRTWETKILTCDEVWLLAPLYGLREDYRGLCGYEAGTPLGRSEELEPRDPIIPTPCIPHIDCLTLNIKTDFNVRDKKTVIVKLG